MKYSPRVLGTVSAVNSKQTSVWVDGGCGCRVLYDCSLWVMMCADSSVIRQRWTVQLCVVFCPAAVCGRHNTSTRAGDRFQRTVSFTNWLSIVRWIGAWVSQSLCRPFRRYFAPGKGASVAICMSLCLSVCSRVSKTVRLCLTLNKIFCTCYRYLWPWQCSAYKGAHMDPGFLYCCHCQNSEGNIAAKTPLAKISLPSPPFFSEKIYPLNCFEDISLFCVAILVSQVCG